MSNENDLDKKERTRGFDPEGKYGSTINNVVCPKEIKEHDKDYINKAWMQYSLDELGQWVHLLVKRAEHRTNEIKKQKDIHDARNYWRMMGAYIDAAEVET